MKCFAGIASRAGFEPAVVLGRLGPFAGRGRPRRQCQERRDPADGSRNASRGARPAPAVAPPHPIDEAKLELAPGSSGVASSADLHSLRQFAGWLPGGTAVRELLTEIGQKLGADPAGPEQERSKIDTAVGDAINSATDRFFSPEVRENVASVMKDAAISVLATEGRDRAAVVMATAAATLSAGLVTSPPHEIPFLRAFFQKALAMVAQQSGGQLSIPVPVAGAGSGEAPVPAPVAP